MNKSKGIFTLLAVVIIGALLGFTTICGWTFPNKKLFNSGAAKNIRTGLDLSGGVSITYEAVKDAPTAAEMDDTVQKLQKRVENYSTEANVYKEGLNRINVEIPGVTDANAVLQELGKPGSLYFIAETDSEGNKNYTNTGSGYVLTKTLEELKKDGSIVCEGKDVAKAEGVAQQAKNTGAVEYAVSLQFTSEGTTKFAEATSKAYTNGESIGIYYDDQFISVPNVNSSIPNGQAQITGMESMEKANELASYLRIGGLSLELNEIRSNVVGAQLGEEAIKTSLIGGAIGLAIVMLIMIVVYLFPGFIASIALALYTALMLVLLNAFDLTLTLPGVAGIILGIGMAVDANVIIYSRIQEEITDGTSVKGAIKAGFHKALSAILDGNITTLIAAAVLGMLGTGPIKGFAMTLALSVALSMFMSLVVSKLLCEAFFAVGVQSPKLWARQKKVTKFRFVKNWKRFLAVAAAVILTGVGFMVYHGTNGDRVFNFSMEFLGGTSTTVDFNESFTLNELDEKVKPLVSEVTGDSNIVFQQVVGSDQVIIKTRTLDLDERREMAETLTENFGIKAESITAESISATVGKEMRRDAVIAVAIAVVLMLLYIFIRFKDLRFAFAAVLALCHDVLIVLMAYAIFRTSVGNSFIAVMLTILGYSINSTIVIFDRIREILGKSSKGVSYEKTVDRAVNVTMTRSIFTNLTTLASVVTLYIMGVASIKEFTFPMMIGICAGALSSVFLTGPLWHFMRTHFGKDAAEIRNADASFAAEEAVALPGSASFESAGKKGNPNVIRKKKNK